MALTKLQTKTVLGQELTFPNAYMKITTIFGNKIEILVSVETYAKKDGEMLSNNQYSVPLVLDGSNFIAQAYDHLKTLPDFAGAADC